MQFIFLLLFHIMNKRLPNLLYPEPEGRHLSEATFLLCQRSSLQIVVFSVVQFLQKDEVVNH